jgi:hypothetical protein
LTLPKGRPHRDGRHGEPDVDRRVRGRIAASQKALRLYGERGLLSPSWVDPESGYRYFRIEQLHVATRLLKEEPMYDVLTKRIDEQAYVSRTKRVLVPELEPFIVETFGALGRDRAARPGFVLYHGPVNAEEDGPVEVCVPTSDGDRRLPAGEIAFTEISGEQCQFPQILGAYEAVYRWVKESGREAGGPAREIYLNGPGGDEQLQIAVPLR